MKPQRCDRNEESLTELLRRRMRAPNVSTVDPDYSVGDLVVNVLVRKAVSGDMETIRLIFKHSTARYRPPLASCAPPSWRNSPRP